MLPMRNHISTDLRNLVATRARRLCEYCLVHEDDAYFGCEVDHIISLKHGGATSAENLAYACVFCNRQKGSDVGSVLWQSGAFIRFFNPRTDGWAEHFRLDGVVITPISEIGEVTTRILGFNDVDRVLERQELADLKRYPTALALEHMVNKT
ncbi:hypothetical protein ANRL3_02496 [Anaerolineae bacterium]|nr:hypothetical protein ANRL3_02496 [Anaerolineae bacterium]